MYGPAETVRTLGQRFAYIFDEGMRPIPGTTKPQGELATLEPGVAVQIAGETVLPIAVPHGHTTVFGYRIGALGYITDAKSSLPRRSRHCLA